jgi:hypothetical protein
MQCLIPEQGKGWVTPFPDNAVIRRIGQRAVQLGYY